MIIQVITTTLHYFWCYLFVITYEMGIEGTAIATTITIFSNLFLITIYVTFFEPSLKEAWTLPDADSFRGLKSYLKLGIPASLMYSLEWWTSEIQIFFASLISVESTAAMAIILNTMYIGYCITLGL